MHVDPKAPFDSPLHPSNIGRSEETEKPADSPSTDELLEVHGTESEKGDDRWPEREELENRAQLVAEYEEDPDPEYAPTVVDLTGKEHRWQGSDEGWQPVEPADDAQEDAESVEEEPAEGPQQDAEVEKPEPRKRTGRHRKAPAKTAAPKLDAALAKLDRSRGKK